ncbi:MAG: hypothetical protein JNM86_12165 [Phycisphaerae bacterium]|nr:hypothetical protein [Phycisphaerae bacterium]
MNSRGFFFAAAAAAGCSFSALAQPAVGPHGGKLMPAPRGVERTVNPNITAGQSRIAWIRNDKTGQVIVPGQTQSRKAASDPVFIYNNFDNPNGIAGINLNWNYPEASTDPDFKPAPGDPRLNFTSFNLSSDPTDIDRPDEIADDERICLMFEPYTAAPGTWPDENLNVRFPIAEYTSVAASYSQQLEIRVCRIYFYSLRDVNLEFDAVTNPYNLELQLSFAFVSFPFQGIETPFLFDLSGFEPPLTIKGKGLIFTHWKKISEPPECAGDLNQDGLVDDTDFVLFLAQYNVLDCEDEAMPNFCSGDLDFDGFVDDADFVKFLASYNNLLCPQGFVVRRAYAPLAGGRYDWANEDNVPDIFSIPFMAKPAGDWPFPSSLVTVPDLNPPYPVPFNVGCSAGYCQPSFNIMFTTLTGFKQVNELNMDAENLTEEYERFLNECVVANSLETLWFYNAALFDQGGYPNTDWYPSSTAKRFSIMPPALPR